MGIREKNRNLQTKWVSKLFLHSVCWVANFQILRIPVLNNLNSYLSSWSLLCNDSQGFLGGRSADDERHVGLLGERAHALHGLLLQLLRSGHQVTLCKAIDWIYFYSDFCKSLNSSSVHLKLQQSSFIVYASLAWGLVLQLTWTPSFILRGYICHVCNIHWYQWNCITWSSDSTGFVLRNLAFWKQCLKEAARWNIITDVTSTDISEHELPGPVIPRARSRFSFSAMISPFSACTWTTHPKLLQWSNTSISSVLLNIRVSCKQFQTIQNLVKI